MELFEVGGCVRDEILGLKSKDIDFSVVMNIAELDGFMTAKGMTFPTAPFDVMVRRLKDMGFEIFLETPEFLTIRARFPKNHENAGITADFVLARKESGYSDGRRPDAVALGTLKDDLARRDFTMNAIAKRADGTLIDPFNGLGDINKRLVRAVGDPFDRIREDKLRLLRALRFTITKQFRLDPDLREAIQFFAYDIEDIAADRIREELEKMFAADWIRSVELLGDFQLLEPIKSLGIRLMPTMKG